MGTLQHLLLPRYARGADQISTFSITAPPIASIAYPTPVTATTDPAAATLACRWLLYDPGLNGPNATPPGGGASAPTLFTYLPALGVDVTVGRFADIVDSADTWCAGQVQELAGLFPSPIVGGYDATHYQPNTNVTRDQMAVFMARALALPTCPVTAIFTDVPTNYWAAEQVEQMYTAGLVGGYTPTTYAPLNVVTRDQMAVFVARGLVMSKTIRRDRRRRPSRTFRRAIGPITKSSTARPTTW